MVTMKRSMVAVVMLTNSGDVGCPRLSRTTKRLTSNRGGANAYNAPHASSNHVSCENGGGGRGDGKGGDVDNVVVNTAQDDLRPHR